MNDEPKKRRRPWIGWAMLLVFLLYPLSFGPATWIVGNSDNWQLLHIYNVTYTPLRWVRDRSETIDRAFFWYAGIWVPHDESEPEE
jgi:hypothetical protein